MPYISALHVRPTSTISVCIHTSPGSESILPSNTDEGKTPFPSGLRGYSNAEYEPFSASSNATASGGLGAYCFQKEVLSPFLSEEGEMLQVR